MGKGFRKKQQEFLYHKLHGLVRFWWIFVSFHLEIGSGFMYDNKIKFVYALLRLSREHRMQHHGAWHLAQG
ncbi:MAG: hypothetical protein J6I64_06540, partial [Lachnospiraceae bacterium]|nr:hypothetical protein [Lachnospiraceae bacterium]